MIFGGFPYIKISGLSGDIVRDAENILLGNGRPKTYAHVHDVAEMNVRIGRMYGLDENKCRIAGYLHDVSAVIKPADMLKYAKENSMPLCEAEERYPFLLHQRMSRIAAAEYFMISDEEILSPIEHHTTLKENASAYDMALFIADKLAWDQEGVPPFYDEVEKALGGSLEKAALVYMKYMEDNGKILWPHDNWKRAMEWLKGIIVR